MGEHLYRFSLACASGFLAIRRIFLHHRICALDPHLDKARRFYWLKPLRPFSTLFGEMRLC